MKAVVITGDPGPGLELTDVPEPVLGPTEVMIQVRAAGVNRADVAQREGRYAQHATARTGPRVAGLEVAGEISAVGSAVDRFAVGEAVMTMCSAGYAEQVAVDQRLVLRKPDRLTFAEAAAVPVAFITAHDAVVTHGLLAAGDDVLVPGGSSVVGVACAQVARAKGAHRVVGTAGGPEKCEQARALGFDEVVDYRIATPEALVDRGPFDLVVDMLAGEWMPYLLRSLRPGGRHVSVGRLRGNDVAFDLDVVAKNRLSILGVSFRTRSLDEYAAVVDRFRADLYDDVAAGVLRPVPVTAFPVERARAAQDHMETSEAVAKVVLTFH
jgi:NADPH2:quinone reductase